MATSPPDHNDGLEGVEDLEGIVHAQVEEDAERSPEEKRNREQSVTGSETAVNERQQERPRADTRPPA